MSYWNYLTSLEIGKKMQPLLQEGVYELDEDDKFYCKAKNFYDGPWLHRKPGSNWCMFYHKVLFQTFGLLPPHCASSCWKVVARPKCVVDLFKLHELQQKTDFPSKCGVELRDYVHALYGGYWYNETKEKGLEKYRIVKELIEKEDFKMEVPLMLKRGCTEMEHKFGRSDRWKVTQKSADMVSRIEQCFIRGERENQDKNPQWGIDNIQKKWIIFAYSNGDSTYLELTGEKTLHPLPITYHDEQEKIEVDINDLLKIEGKLK